MSALALVAALRDRGITLSAVGGRLEVRPASALTGSDRDAIRAHAADLLAILTAPAALPPAGLPGLDPSWSRLVDITDSAGARRTFHVLDSWTGPGAPVGTLLCVHGNPTWSYLWRRPIAELSTQGRRCVAFDHMGFGRSDKPPQLGRYTLQTHIANALALIDELVEGPVVLVGSSMGGWLMLLVARARPERVVGMVGVAAAPDFTDWGFTTDEKLYLLSHGRLERPNPYGPAPTVYTRAFWSSGEANRLMFGEIAFDGPVRLVQGQRDPDVPWHRTARLAELLRSADVQTWLVKDGDHRLSRDPDIALIIRAVEDVIAAL